MSVFSIKLKTKAGNDVKKKQTFTVFFRLNFKPGVPKVVEYTYRIIHPMGIIDTGRVLELKIAKEVKTIEDLTLKVMLNFCHLIGKVTQQYNIDPDFIMFISPDLGDKKNHSWQFLNDVFKRPKAQKDKKGNFIGQAVVEDPFDWLEEYSKEYEEIWSEKRCSKLGIKKEELDLLKAFGDLNPNTLFMSIDPNRDMAKYAKSLHICSMLKDRLDRNLQVTEVIK